MIETTQDYIKLNYKKDEKIKDMKPIEVSYRMVFNLGNYSSEEIALKYSLNEDGGTGDEVIPALKRMREEVIKSSTPHLQKLRALKDKEVEALKKDIAK